MSKKKFDLVTPGPFECVVCGKIPKGYCSGKNCSALICKSESCLQIHKQQKHANVILTPSKCCACGNPPTGQECAYCPAVICDYLGCREKHEEDFHPSMVEKERP